MIKLETKTMTKAIERARAIRPRVRVHSADHRQYGVTGSQGNEYTVFFVVVNGHRLASCDCPAGRREQLCYHIAAAAQVNVMVQSMRKAAATRNEARGGREALIRSINATWQRKYPTESLADELMRRFKCNSLSFLATGWLRDILIAIA